MRKWFTVLVLALLVTIALATTVLAEEAIPRPGPNSQDLTHIVG